MCENVRPTVVILATGGTIAGQGTTGTQMTGYHVGDVGIDALIEAVPQLTDYAEIRGEQIVNIQSSSMTDEILLRLAKRVNEVLADDSVTGVVVTHGTDTLEETAYFLNLTVKSVKPVIVVGAMRPSTAISADGPVNLLNAVRLAVDPVAIDRGVMIVLNDEINGARDCTKTNTTNLATFKAPEAGLLGYIAGGRHYFIKKTALHHTVHTEFDVRHLDVLPRVDIVYSYINADGIMVRAAIAAGAKGIVHAGSGNGSVHDDTLGALFDARDHGVAVVRASRVGNGVVTEDCEEWTEAGLLDAATLNPQKSRILLQLGLTITDDPIQLQRMFYEY